MEQDQALEWWGNYRTFINVMNDLHELLVVDAYKEDQPVKEEHLRELHGHMDDLVKDECISQDNADNLLADVRKGGFAAAEGFAEGLWMKGLIDTFPKSD